MRPMPCPPPVTTATLSRIEKRSCIVVGPFWRFRRYVGGGDAAVDDELSAGHERRLVGGKVERSLGDLLGLPEAADRNVHEAPLQLLFRVQELHQQPCL